MLNLKFTDFSHLIINCIHKRYSTCHFVYLSTASINVDCFILSNSFHLWEVVFNLPHLHVVDTAFKAEKHKLTESVTTKVSTYLPNKIKIYVDKLSSNFYASSYFSDNSLVIVYKHYINW